MPPLSLYFDMFFADIDIAFVHIDIFPASAIITAEGN